MKITNIKPLNLTSGRAKTLAVISLELEDGAAVVRDVFVKESNGKYFLSMPSKKYTNKDGETKYYEIVRLNKVAANKVVEIVLEKLREAEAEIPKINKIEENTDFDPTVEI